MSALTWDEIKRIQPADPVLILEPPTTKVRNAKSEMVPMARADRRRNRRGAAGDYDTSTRSPRASAYTDTPRASVAARNARRTAALLASLGRTS
jgi:hypothetical protein